MGSSFDWFVLISNIALDVEACYAVTMTKIQFDDFTKTYVDDLRKHYVLGVQASLTEAERVYTMDAIERDAESDFEDALGSIEENITEVLTDEFEKRTERQNRTIENLRKKLASFEEMTARFEAEIEELKRG